MLLEEGYVEKFKKNGKIYWRILESAEIRREREALDFIIDIFS